MFQTIRFVTVLVIVSLAMATCRASHHDGKTKWSASSVTSGGSKRR